MSQGDDAPGRDGRVAAGMRLARAGRLEEALRVFDTAVAARPDDAAAWRARGLCQAKLGRPADALEDYERALGLLRADEAGVARMRGAALLALDHVGEACTALTEAVELAPESADAAYDLGVALGRLGLLPDAAGAYERAIELAPEHADAWGNLGVVLVDAGRLEDAAAALERATELAPRDPEPWFVRGVCLAELGRHGEALAAYDRVLALTPDDPDAWNNRGVALHELGRLDEARAAYDRAIELDPDATDAPASRALLDAPGGTFPSPHDGNVASGALGEGRGDARGGPRAVMDDV